MCFLFPNETGPPAPFNLILAKRVHGPIKTQLVAGVSRRCDMKDEHNKRKETHLTVLLRQPPRHWTDPLFSPTVHSSLILQPSPQRRSSEELRKTPSPQYRCVLKGTLEAASMNVVNVTVTEGLSFGFTANTCSSTGCFTEGRSWLASW